MSESIKAVDPQSIENSIQMLKQHLGEKEITPLLAVLERIEKPGNVGAVVRSADGAGVSAVILADAVTDLYNPNAIRASLGTIFTLPVCSTTSREV